jgi:hypothetical protein
LHGAGAEKQNTIIRFIYFMGRADGMVNDHFLHRYSVLPQFAGQFFPALIAAEKNNLFNVFIADHFIGQVTGVIANGMDGLFAKIPGGQLAGRIPDAEDGPLGRLSVYVSGHGVYSIHAGEYYRGWLFYDLANFIPDTCCLGWCCVNEGYDIDLDIFCLGSFE